PCGKIDARARRPKACPDQTGTLDRSHASEPPPGTGVGADALGGHATHRRNAEAAPTCGVTFWSWSRPLRAPTGACQLVLAITAARENERTSAYRHLDSPAKSPPKSAKAAMTTAPNSGQSTSPFTPSPSPST